MPLTAFYDIGPNASREPVIIPLPSDLPLSEKAILVAAAASAASYLNPAINASQTVSTSPASHATFPSGSVIGALQATPVPVISLSTYQLAMLALGVAAIVLFVRR